MRMKISTFILASFIGCGMMSMVCHAETTIKSIGVITYADESHNVKFDYRDFVKMEDEVNSIGRLGNESVTSTGDMKVVNDKIAAYVEHCK